MIPSARAVGLAGVGFTCAAIAALFAIAVVGCAEEEGLGPPPVVGAPSGGDASTAPPGPASASAGESAVRARKCGDCHGGNFAGTGGKLAGYPDGVELFAPNLTPDMETGIGSWTDAQLELAIREGLDKEGMVLCPQMKHYRDMPAAELTSIVQYLRSLPPIKNAVRESICPPLKR